MADKEKIVIKPQQLNSIRWLLSTLAYGLIVIIAVQYIATDIIAPLLFAVFLTVIMYPIFKWFRRRGLSSGLSIVCMVITFFVAVGVTVFFLSWSFSLISDSLAVYTAQLKESFTQTAQSMNIDSSVSEGVASGITTENIQFLGNFLISSLGNVIFYLVVIPILSVLMILQIDSVPPSFSKRMKASNVNTERYKKFADNIILYVSSRLKINIATGLAFAASLIILGIPFPFVWGFLTVFLSFIPYIGIVIASIPPIILAFAQGGLPAAVLVILAMCLVNFFAENVLAPAIQGKDFQISMAAVAIAFIFWTWLLGPIGAILAMPLTVFLKLILEDFKETHFIALLMEGNYEPKKNGPSFYKKYLDKLGKVVPGKNHD